MLAAINVKLGEIVKKAATMKKRRKVTTPEQWAKWEANQRRLEEIIERRLKEDAARAQAALAKAG